MTPLERASEIIRRCHALARCSEEPQRTTRTFLSAPMREVHALVTEWMRSAGMTTQIDAAGNLRGVYRSVQPVESRRLIIGSHLDTVPNAGAFDGILGVVLAVSLVEQLEGRRYPYAVEVVGFSEEEGVRFGAPFIGSRAFAGTLDDALLDRQDSDGWSVREVMRQYGLAVDHLDSTVAAPDSSGFLEFHIEQGPVLDNLGLPLGVVDAIVGQSRCEVVFEGEANHAGTTPMAARRDALAAAAEWMVQVERLARDTPHLVATVGRVVAEPGASNVIPGRCRTTLDLRHHDDAQRHDSLEAIASLARTIASSRQLRVSIEPSLEQKCVPMDSTMTAGLVAAVGACGYPVHRMTSGAGHDAMIVATRMPVAMLFVRSPGGISHHPDETVLVDDVAAALTVGAAYLEACAHA